jgi:hypothetical protein
MGGALHICLESILSKITVFAMKILLLSLLTVPSLASPLLESRQACPASGISAARAAEVRSKFQSSRVIPDSVPNFTPTTELRVRYGNINENLGNKFSVLRTAAVSSGMK